MCADGEDEPKSDTVVWLKLTGYPWWPCRVEGDCYVSFGDDCSYSINKFKSSEVKPHKCAELTTLVAKEMKKIRNKKKTQAAYKEAVELTNEYVKSHYGEQFQIVLDSSAAMQETKDTLKKGIEIHKNGTGSDSASESILCDSSQGHDADRHCSDIPTLNNGSSGSPQVSRGKKKKLSKDSTEHKANKVSKPPKIRRNKRKREDSTELDTSPLVQSLPLSKKTKTSETPPPCDNSSPSQFTSDPTPALAESIPVAMTPAPSTPVATTPLASTPAAMMPGCPLPAPGASTPITIISDSISTLTNSSCCSTSPAPPLELYSGDEGGYSSASDDDLPKVDLSVRENIALHELKPRDVVWAKYRKWPFWPALVSKIYKKKKHTKGVSLIFFGYSDNMVLKIARKNNIALFGSKQSKDFYSKGLEYPHDQDQFKQAFKEARELVREMAEGAYKDILDPKEVFLKAISNRPMDYDSTSTRYIASETEESEEEEAGVADSEPISVLCVTEDDDSEAEEDESVEDTDRSVHYSYEEVSEGIRALHPLLEDICRGAEKSEFHDVFMGGTKNQRRSLKFGDKFGPILKGWKDEEKTRLIEDNLVSVARKVGYGFDYCFDVLLPEAMVRLISKFKKMSYEAALENFYS